MTWTLRQWLTFIAFFTPIGWAAMFAAGLALWLLAPIPCAAIVIAALVWR